MEETVGHIEKNRLSPKKSLVSKKLQWKLWKSRLARVVTPREWGEHRYTRRRQTTQERTTRKYS